MKFKYCNGEEVFETNVSLFADDGNKVIGEVFVDYDSDRFRLILNHFRQIGHHTWSSLEYDLNRMEEAVGCESRMVRIGGKRFWLGLKTFEKIPFLKGKTSFENLKYGSQIDLNRVEFDLNSDDDEIDMDSTMFRRIVSYLRNPNCHSLTDGMRVEMAFYGIELSTEKKNYEEAVWDNLRQVLTYPQDDEKQITTWTKQDFKGWPDFGRRVTCEVDPYNKFNSIIYLYVITYNLGQILEVDQIINRIELEIRGIRINQLSGFIIKNNQILGLNPQTISWQEPDREFYLIPIDLFGIKGGTWVDHPLQDQVRINIEFNNTNNNYDYDYDYDYNHRMEHSSLYFNFVTTYNFSLSKRILLYKETKDMSIDDPFLKEAKNLKEISIKVCQYTKEYFSVKFNKTKLYLNGEIKGIFVSFDNIKTSNLTGIIEISGKTHRHFDQVTNKIEQMTQFGSFCSEILYIHLEINMNRVDDLYLVINNVESESDNESESKKDDGILYCWSYANKNLPISLDEEGNSQTINNNFFYHKFMNLRI